MINDWIIVRAMFRLVTAIHGGTRSAFFVLVCLGLFAVLPNQCRLVVPPRGRFGSTWLPPAYTSDSVYDSDSS